MMFDAYETSDVETFVRALAPDVKGTFGNAPQVVGVDAARATFDQLFTIVTELRHHVVSEWMIGDEILVEVTGVWTLRDGRTVELPAMIRFTVNDTGQISAYRVFIDPSPVFAPQ